MIFHPLVAENKHHLPKSKKNQMVLETLILIRTTSVTVQTNWTMLKSACKISIARILKGSEFRYPQPRWKKSSHPYLRSPLPGAAEIST